MTAPKTAPTLSAPALTALPEAAAEAAITTACRTLMLPTVRAEAVRLAAAAAKQRLSHKAFLAEVLLAECDERDARRQLRRVKEAKFPRTKRLSDFNIQALPDLPPATLAHLASGAWIDKGEPVNPARGLRHRENSSTHRVGHHRRRTRALLPFPWVLFHDRLGRTPCCV